MRLLLKILGVLLGLVALLGLGGLGYLFLVLPRVAEAPDVRVEITPARVERGQYLANHVALCTMCHSERDWTRFSGPVLPGHEGNGGDAWGRTQGLPGELKPGNLTPAGLEAWSDGEIVRAITEGVHRDGTPLFPVMPYPEYRHMPTEDVYAIVAYLRSLPSVPSMDEAPLRREIDFPVSLIVRTIPEPADPLTIDLADKVVYGRYLATVGQCEACHSPRNQGTIIPELRFAGGAEPRLPDGTIVPSANITPHRTGIGAWSEEQFVARFKAYELESTDERLELRESEGNTMMPWVAIAGMTREDLSAIYAYLRTVPPVEQRVRTPEPR